jgi:amino acid transporter
MPRLKKDLTLHALTMVAIGSCIGSGIFRTPTEIAGHLRSPGWILAAWALGGLIALTGALTFAELGAMFPRAGGVYAYLREAYGPFAGFLYGWAYFTVINSGALAALSLTFTDWIFFTAAAGAVILFRRTRRDAERPYRVFGYPVTPLLFIVPSLAFVENTLIEKPAQAGAGLALLTAGLPVYLAFRRKRAAS